MQRSFTWILGMSILGSILVVANLQADDEGKAPTEQQGDSAKADKKVSGTKKSASRLPRHYDDVITEEQREKVASVLAEFNAKIAKLKNEIKTATAERDKALEELLTTEQKTKLAKLKEEAKDKDRKLKSLRDAQKKPIP